MRTSVRIKVYTDVNSLVREAANQIVSLAAPAIKDRGRFSLGLSGGSTPEPLYRALATERFTRYLDWSHVHVFWGDERCVPPDHADSNFRMAREALLDQVPLPADHIHRIEGELDPELAAARYEQVLTTFFGQQETGDIPSRPRFDVLILGMGDDGHTASLFPGTTALGEQVRWVVPNYVDKLGVWRVTLTALAINSAAHILFLVSGTEKAGVLRKVLLGPRQPQVYPAQLIYPDDGLLTWHIDAQAVAELRA